MTKSRSIVPCALVVALVAGHARAWSQQLPPQPVAPPPSMRVLPPAYLWPTPAEINELERAGRQKKFAGIMLMTGGASLVIAGVALAIAGSASDDHFGCDGYGYGYGYGNRYGYGYRFPSNNRLNDIRCGDRALTIAGATTTVLGLTALGVGIPVYIIGGSQVARARCLRRQLALQPSVQPMGAGVRTGMAVALAF